MPECPHETSPLLQDEERGQEEREEVYLSKEDGSNPRDWPKWKKLANIAVIASMSLLSPLASSMFTPGIQQIAESFNSTENAVIACQTGFVVMLGIGPLILAPLSETFGRKYLYLTCFGAFTVLQIPTALAPSLPVLITLRTIAGFFGSIGIANGGGTISDMYEPSERAGIFGWYLLGPLLGPTIGPLLGALILTSLPWPYIFYLLLILSSLILLLATLFLHETYVPVLLSQRLSHLQRTSSSPQKYYIPSAPQNPSLVHRILHSITRPLKILFTQPIVLTMATYQALLFSITYSLYTQFSTLYSSPPYKFSTLQVGLIYLSPGLGFLIAVWFLVPRIGSVYNSLTAKNGGKGKPEYRLPLANIGSVLIPISVFTFGWSIQYHAHWAVTLVPLFFYGIGQVAIFNSVQNYYIDAFEKYAASAIAAGALFRSVIGGVVPLFTGALLERLGVGWGMSVFGFLSLVVAPSPVLFWYYGEGLRERFRVEL